MKNKFYKNLYQSLCAFGSFLLIFFPVIIGCFNILDFGFAIGVALLLFVLYFLLGGYWIFQKVEFNNEQIKITIFGKCVRVIKWEEINKVAYGSFARNSVYSFDIKGEKILRLDARKSLKKSMLHYCNNSFVNEMLKSIK